MKFVYHYRTPDNKAQQGEITAASKEAVYVALKKKGVRPVRVEEAPGLLNKVFGKGKRWLAIGGLAVVVVVMISVTWLRNIEDSEQALFDDRSQLYGDPVVISECEENGWRNVFESELDRYLVHYAIPGRPVSDDIAIPRHAEGELDLCVPSTGDLEEVARMKRIVNGMKREMSQYLVDGGSRDGYFKRLSIRQRAECGFVYNAQLQIRRTKDHSFWRKKNAELRAMGLPMVSVEEQ